MLVCCLETNMHISFLHLMPAVTVCLLRFETTSKPPFFVLHFWIYLKRTGSWILWVSVLFYDRTRNVLPTYSKEAHTPQQECNYGRFHAWPTQHTLHSICESLLRHCWSYPSRQEDSSVHHQKLSNIPQCKDISHLRERVYVPQN